MFELYVNKAGCAALGNSFPSLTEAVLDPSSVPKNVIPCWLLTLDINAVQNQLSAHHYGSASIILRGNIVQTEIQRQVTDRLHHQAFHASKDSHEDINKVLGEAGLSTDEINKIRKLVESAEITITLAPDRPVGASSKPLIDRLIDGIEYKNTWQTGHSGGAMQDGGKQRNDVEVQLFRYPRFKGEKQTGMSWEANNTEEEAADRPRFGAVNLFLLTTSATQNKQTYGDISLVLRPGISNYATITPGDSNRLAGWIYRAIEHITNKSKNLKKKKEKERAEDQIVSLRAKLPPVGAFDDLDHLLHWLYRENKDFRDGINWDALISALRKTAHGLNSQAHAEFWEAQIHAPISFENDVAFMRASYRKFFGTPVGDKIQRWARKNGWPLIWGHETKVILDPTIRPLLDSDLVNADTGRWSFRRATGSDLGNATRQFNERWRVIAGERKLWEDGLPKKSNLSVHWDALWMAVPDVLRIEPQMREDETTEPLQNALRSIRFKQAEEKPRPTT